MIDPDQPDFSNTPVSNTRPDFGYRLADPNVPATVSVVTPFFNPGPVFEETAASILGQSMQQFEWIIVDDGTSDPTSLALLDDLQASDPRIRVITHPTTLGVSQARNSGFEMATTDFVFQLDSDDLIEPTTLEKLYWCLTSYPQLSFAKGFTVGFGAESYFWRNGFHSGSAFLQQNMADVMTMIRRSVHAAVGGYDPGNLLGLEDWEFWIRCAANGYWGDTVPEYLGWYRRRASHGDRWPNWDGGDRETGFLVEMQARYPDLWAGGFPTVGRDQPGEMEPIFELDSMPNRLVKDKPRIMLIVPWLTLGGADKFNLDCITELTRRGWQATVVTTVDGDHGWEPTFGLHTPDIFALHRFCRPSAAPGFIRYLIESRQPDVVMISNSELGYRLLPYLRSRCPEPIYLDFCHMEQPEWKNGGYPAMSALFSEQLDLTLAASDHLKAWIGKRDESSARIETCYLGVDPHLWQPDPEVRTVVRNELEIEEETPVILFAARLMPQKQPQVLAEVMKRLNDAGHDFVAVVAGDGPDRAWLETFVDQHDLRERVRMVGAVPSDRVRCLLQAADIFFLPSTWEGIALSLYEAMACGVAVVGAEVGGQAELVTPDTGTLLERSDPEEEIKAYTQVLANLLDDGHLRTEMGMAARQRVVDHFSLDHLGERLVDLIGRARELSSTDPRPRLTEATGTAVATLALDHLRLETVAQDLWRRLQGTPPQLPDRRSVGGTLYHWLTAALGPAYRWAMSHQVRGVWRVRTTLRKVLKVDRPGQST